MIHPIDRADRHAMLSIAIGACPMIDPSLGDDPAQYRAPARAAQRLSPSPLARVKRCGVTTYPPVSPHRNSSPDTPAGRGEPPRHEALRP